MAAKQREETAPWPALVAREAEDVVFALQVGLVDVEVHAVEALDFQGHVSADDVGDGASR